MNNAITYNRLRELVYYKGGELYWNKNGKLAGSIDNKGYKRISLDYIRYKVHRIVWFYFNKTWPKQQIDHINGNKLDNRIENLRDVKQTINMYNKQEAHSNSKTGYLGVTKQPTGKYTARIKVGDKLIHLGSFDTIIEAHNIYKEYKNKITLYEMD